MYRRTAALDIFLWGRHVGTLAPDFGATFQFQYDPEFVASGLNIAPLHMPLRKDIYHFSDFGLPASAFYGVPGVFADSLPDSFGNQLITSWMRQQGISPAEITTLDRLAYVGSRGMGALTYEPQQGPRYDTPSVLDMRRLLETARQTFNEDILARSGDDALREIVRVGTSAGGAQAKAVVAWNRATGSFKAGDGEMDPDDEAWIIKFTPREDPEAGKREYAVYLKALAAGIEMSESRLYELDGVGHFMTRRFDRVQGRRLHLSTLCALQHLPLGGPRSLYSYDRLFETAIDLHLGYDALEQIFRRMAFNVLMRETDDHTKNFSFLMDEKGRWSLAPAYDLTGAHISHPDPVRGEFENPHALAVNGRFAFITDDDILAVAGHYGLGTAPRILKNMREMLNVH